MTPDQKRRVETVEDKFAATSILEKMAPHLLRGEQGKKGPDKDVPIDKRLAYHGLSLDEMLPAMADIIQDDEVLPSTKLAAIRDVLKMHGVLKENPQGSQVAVVININDSEKPTIKDGRGKNVEINPILVPRELVGV
jgi:hypothetical protein